MQTEYPSTRVDYTAFVLRTETFHEQGYSEQPYVDLSIFRVEEPELCEHCGESAEYLVEADSVGGQDMFYCQEYMDNARQAPDFPDEFILRIALHDLMGLEEPRRGAHV